MKELNLPITQKFATCTVDMHEALKDLASGKIYKIPLGSTDFGTSSKALNQARANGGMIIWSATCLEEKLDTLIIRFVFSAEDSQNQKGKQFFVTRIMKSDHLSYAAKKSLVVDIVNRESLLAGRDKDDLEKYLKDIMDFRNAFAHGEVTFEEDKGCVLSYWRGGHRRDVLSEEYWCTLENIFKRADQLIEQAFAHLSAVRDSDKGRPLT
jgi:hypothetical protein